MLVHKFYLVECIQVEFKFELNSNRFEWKQESESVILSFLSHSRSLSILSHSFLSLSHSFCSQSFLIFSVIPSFLSHSRSFLSYSFFLGHSPSSTPPVGPFFLLLLRRSTSPRDLRRAPSPRARTSVGPPPPYKEQPPTHPNPNPSPCVAPRTPSAAAGEALRPRNSSPSVIPGPP
jgi:hypothetical protein